MHLFLFSLLLTQAYASDIIVESLLRTLDYNSDPCDDFYRHACPLGSNSSYSELIDENMSRTHGVWKEFQLVNDFKTETFNLSVSASKLFVELCKNGNDTHHFFQQLEKVALYNKPFTHFELISDCEKVGDAVRRAIVSQNETVYQDEIRRFNDAINLRYKNLKAINFLLDSNLENVVEEMRDMVENVKEIAKELISETPWARNNDVTEFNQKILEMTVLPNDYARTMRKSLNFLFKFELIYRQCKQNFNFHKDSQALCFGIANLQFDKNTPLEEAAYFDYENAFNDFPEIRFGFPFYLVAGKTESMAAKLGAVGFVVGHELSHTLIKDKSRDPTQPYFSQEALDCVQTQYNSTCNMFKEESCEVNDETQYDENGSDVLSVQMVYRMLEEFYGEQLKEVYKPLNVTNQQLFFYSMVPFFCDGSAKAIRPGQPHSAANVRINAVANHPAFKEAFQCSDDSRMIKSATRQCMIYGKDAPQTKR